MKSDREAATIFERPSSSKPRAPDEPLAPPQGHARYEIGVEIARGGMGRVVEANDTLLGRTVALKEALADNDDVLRRFRREIYITARLEHPSIVPVHDAGTAPDGSLFYVMRKVTGRPLTELIGGAATLEARLALLPHVVAAAQAIAHAHRRGVIHRDIKPSNILVGELGETIVIDWGLAKVIGEADDASIDAVDAGSSLRTRYGTVFGTPGFMAPEQARGERVDARSDVYALGATLYYTFTRQPPHASANEDEMMVAAASGPPQPIGEIVHGLPRELSTIVDKSLAYDDRERYADAGALAEDLQRFLTGQLVASHRYSTRERVGRFVRRNKVAVAIAAIAIVTVAIGGALAVRGIVSARDRADTQAQLATARELDAEAAREREQQRGDQLLLLQARGLAQTNPTAAVAFLKQLVQPAERWDRLWRQARGVAATAMFNGVAYVMPGPTSKSQCRISPTAKRAATLGRDGDVMVYDLEHRTSSVLKLPRIFNLGFADDDHLLALFGPTLFVIDLRSGEQRTTNLGLEARDVVGSPTAYFVQGMGFELLRVDPATLAVSRVLIGDRVSKLVVSNDDHWLAIGGFKTLWLLDLQHGETIKQLDTGEPLTLRWDHDSKHLAAAFLHTARIYSLDGKPPVSRDFGRDMVFDVAVTPTGTYYNTASGLYVTQGTQLLPLSPQGRNDTGSQLKMMGGMVVIARGDKLEVFERYRRYSLTSPTGELGIVATTSRGHRVVSATPGHLLVWNLDDHYPQYTRLEQAIQFMMGGNDYALVNQSFPGWSWVDLPKLRGTTLPTMHLGFAAFSSGLSGTITATDGSEDGEVFMVSQGKAIMLHEPSVEYLTSLTAGGVALLTKSGVLVRYDAAGKRDELARHAATPSDLDAISEWIACAFEDGYVMRINLVTGTSESVQTQPRQRLTISLAPDGTALLGVGRSLLRWQRDGLLLLHATLPLPITNQNALAHHSNVQTTDGGTYTVTYSVPAQIVALAAGLTGWFAYTSELGVYPGSDGELMMVDAFSGTTWPIPTPNGGSFPSISSTQMSDDGHRLGAIISNDLYLWDTSIPLDRDATARWLDQLTNATAELGTATLTFH